MRLAISPLKRLQVRAMRFYLTVKLVAVFRKPLALMTMIRSYLHALVARSPVLRGVDIVTNYSCNLSCKHCNISTMTRPGNERLSKDEYRNIEIQCTQLGVFQYTFTGGEPLLLKDFQELLRIFKPYKRIIIVQTNGTVIDSEEKARSLKKSGVDIVNVSLDSGIPGENDDNRGANHHFEKTINAIRYSRNAGMGIIIGTVVSHENIHSEGMEQLIALAKKEKVILLFNLAVPTGNWHNNKSILLTEEDQQYIRDLIHSNPYCRMDMDSTINQYGCPAFKEKLYITPYGDVTGCTFVQVSFGNTREHSLRDIRKKALQTAFMNKYAKRCYAAEDPSFIDTYMSQLGSHVPVRFDALDHHGRVPDVE